MGAGKASPSPGRRRVARAEAAAWIVKLHGQQRDAEMEAAFRSWLSAEAENAREFERVTETWEAGASAVPGMPRVALPKSKQRWNTRRVAAVAACMMILGLGLWSVPGLWGGVSYDTGIGEQRIVRLEDGSRVILNADTRLSVALGENERKVQVTRGEALFEVAGDPQRPFYVNAGTYRVEALGTEFSVRLQPERTTVVLVEGSVAVSARDGLVIQDVSTVPDGPAEVSRDPPVSEPVVLSPGQRLTMESTGNAKLDRPRPENLNAWRRGEVVLDRTTLKDAVAEMNRYDQTQLIVDDADIARLSVSGIYHAGDSAGFAHTIARLYGLRVEEEGGRIRLGRSQ